MMQLFLLFILAHLVSDFVIQTDALIKRKKVYWRKIKFSKGLTEHVLHHIMITFLLVFSLYGFDLSSIPPIIIIGCFHYFIDFFTGEYSERLIKKCREKNDRERTIFHHLLTKRTFYFAIDQMFHLLTIYLVLFMFNKIESMNLLIQSAVDLYRYDAVFDIRTKIILLCILVILLIFASGYLINKILLDIKKEDENELAAALEQDEPLFSDMKKIDKNVTVEHVWERTEGTTKRSLKIHYHDFLEPELDRAGKYIGFLERFLIGVFIILEMVPGLALLATLKTIARFKQFESKAFAEYYLIGTLLSFSLGICWSLLIKFVLQL